MIVRHLDQALASHFVKYNEVLVLLGARQVGKTTILKRIFPDAHYLVVDNDPIKNALERYDPAVYRQLLNIDSGVVVLDEIQKIKREVEKPSLIGAKNILHLVPADESNIGQLKHVPRQHGQTNSSLKKYTIWLLEEQN